MNDIVWEILLPRQPDSAEHCARLAHELALKTGDRRSIALALGGRAAAAKAKHDPAQALSFSREILELQKRQNDPASLADAMFNLARLYQDMGLSDSAQFHYERCAELRKPLKDQRPYANTLNNIGNLYIMRGDAAKAFTLMDSVLAIRQRIRDKKGMAASYNNIGSLHRNLGHYGSALEYFEKSLALNVELADSIEIAGNLNNMGTALQGMGLFGDAVEQHLRALRMNEAVNYSMGQASALHNIGLAYKQMGEIDSALVYHESSLNICERIGMRQGIAYSLTELGNLNKRMGRNAEALAQLEQALAIHRELGYRTGMATALTGIALVLRKQGAHAKAMDRLQECLRICEAAGDTNNMVLTLVNMGRTRLEMRDVGQAARTAEIAESMSDRVEEITTKLELAELLFLAYKANGRMAEALSMHERFVLLRDSIRSEENIKEITRQAVAHTYQKRVLSDSLLHASEVGRLKDGLVIETLRADRNRDRAWGLGAGGVLLAGLGILFVRSDRRRRRYEHERDLADLRSRSLRAQMDPHFIGNAMQSIHHYMDNNDAARAGDLLVKFSDLMRAVLENSAHQQVPLEEDFAVLRDYLEFERARSNDRFDHSVDIDPALAKANAQIPPLVVQPFLENAIRHGLLKKEGRGRLTLRARKLADTLRIEVEDDGVGRGAVQTDSNDRNGRRSISTGITRERLELLGRSTGRKADLRILDLPQGTRVEIDLPLGMED